MNLKYAISILAIMASLVGCAHPLVISPDLEKIDRPASALPINKNVGYIIPDELRELEVVTPGGGGDKVSYKPYRDVEVGFFKMLTNVFGNATKLKGASDAEAIQKNKVTYIFTPKLVTNSSSGSIFTWPPTKFTLDLTCQISDAAGNAVMSRTAMGEGLAEFDEFKANFSLSGTRASADALMKMQKILLEEPALRN